MKTRETSPRASLSGKDRRSDVGWQTAACPLFPLYFFIQYLTRIFLLLYSVIQDRGRGRGVVAKTSLPEGRRE